MPKNHVSAADILLIAGILLLAVFLLLPRPSDAGDSFTLLCEEGEKTYSLRENHRITVTSAGITLTVVCEDGCVRVAESTCSDGICTGTGAVSRPGESIVCLPAKTAVMVTGTDKEESDEDFIVG